MSAFEVEGLTAFFFACARAFLFCGRRGSALSLMRAVIFHLRGVGSGSGEGLGEGAIWLLVEGWLRHYFLFYGTLAIFIFSAPLLEYRELVLTSCTCKGAASASAEICELVTCWFENPQPALGGMGQAGVGNADPDSDPR